MGILFDVPRFGTEATSWKQKGPTCWYYASKMMLLFHDMYKGATATESNTLYEEWKTLHEIRAVLSAMADGRGDSDQVKKALKDKCDALELYLKNQPPNNQDQQVLAFFNAIQQKNPGAEKAQLSIDRLKQAIERAGQIAGDITVRIELLASFVPSAGFKERSSAEVFKDEATLDGELRAWGPFYAGGKFIVATEGPADKPVSKRTPVIDPETNQPKKIGSNIGRGGAIGDTVLSVQEFRESSHAILIVGIQNSEVFYKDPNGSNVVLKYPFADFKTRLHENIIYLWCADGRDVVDNDGMCSHMVTRTINL